MSYTKHIVKDGLCNYLDLSEKNSHMMLLSCINFDQKKENITNKSIHNVNQSTFPGTEILEGFSSDMGINGVSYVPDGQCPVGHTKVGDQCHQLCRGCNYTDEKGIFGSSHLSSFNICGQNGVFNGLDMNGQIQCSLKKNNENNENNILSFFLY